MTTPEIENIVEPSNKKRDRIIITLFCFFGFLILFIFLWKISFSFDRLLNLAFAFAGTYLLSLIWVAVSELWANHKNEKKLEFTELLKFSLILFILMLALSGYMILAIFASELISDFLNNPTQAEQKDYLVGIFSALFIGIVLFILRLNVRTLYALIEIFSALLLVMHLIDKRSVEANVEFLFQFLTAVYLIVRGIDNGHAGLKSDSPDLLIRFVRSRKGARKITS